MSFASLPSQRKQTVLRALIEALVVADWNYLLENPNTPALYDANLRYALKVRPAGLDSWQDIPQCIYLGSADCKDLSAWRIAELRNQGYDDVFPRIKVSYHQDPKGIEPTMTVYHVQVRIRDVIEDPSAILGMPTNVTYDQLRGGDGGSNIAVLQQQPQAASGFFQTEGGIYMPDGYDDYGYDYQPTIYG